MRRMQRLMKLLCLEPRLEATKKEFIPKQLS